MRYLTFVSIILAKLLFASSSAASDMKFDYAGKHYLLKTEFVKLGHKLGRRTFIEYCSNLPSDNGLLWESISDNEMLMFLIKEKKLLDFDNVQIPVSQRFSDKIEDTDYYIKPIRQIKPLQKNTESEIYTPICIAPLNSLNNGMSSAQLTTDEIRSNKHVQPKGYDRGIFNFKTKEFGIGALQLGQKIPDFKPDAVDVFVRDGIEYKVVPATTKTYGECLETKEEQDLARKYYNIQTDITRYVNELTSEIYTNASPFLIVNVQGASKEFVNVNILTNKEGRIFGIQGAKMYPDIQYNAIEKALNKKYGELEADNYGARLYSSFIRTQSFNSRGISTAQPHSLENLTGGRPFNEKLPNDVFTISFEGYMSKITRTQVDNDTLAIIYLGTLDVEDFNPFYEKAALDCKKQLISIFTEAIKKEDMSTFEL